MTRSSTRTATALESFSALATWYALRVTDPRSVLRAVDAAAEATHYFTMSTLAEIEQAGGNQESAL